MGSHFGLECLLESAYQRFDGRCAGCMRSPDAELLHSSGPVVLVVMLRDEDLGRAGSCRGVRGPCAAVVDDGNVSNRTE